LARQAASLARFEQAFSQGAQRLIAGWSSPVARQAHNLKVASSNLAPATKLSEPFQLARLWRAFPCVAVVSNASPRNTTKTICYHCITSGRVRFPTTRYLAEEMLA